MSKRITGIDVSRALAVIGMIIVNFKIVFGGEGPEWVKTFADLFTGKAAAAFVVLAGVGIALMTNSSLQPGMESIFKERRLKIAKRALLLFLIGTSYLVIWPADILHFYGIYMLITLLLLRSNEKIILGIAIGMILVYPITMAIWDYETAWNFTTLKYADLWSVNGFVRNLFYNGFHPVLPWTAFMLIGLWFGRKDLTNNAFVKKTFQVSVGYFLGIQALSYLSIHLLGGGNPEQIKELIIVLGMSPMPPLPIYMFNGIAFAIALITGCILLCNRFSGNWLLSALQKTGQLALTFYVAHVLIGMGIPEALNSTGMGQYSIVFSLGYAVLFSVCCVLFAVIWSRFFKQGPLEWLLKRLTN